MTGTSDNGSRVESLIIATVHQHRLEQRVEELETALATARDTTLEEAAREAVKQIGPYTDGPVTEIAGKIYDAIRALKGKQP
jgi:hypothetical protein